MEIWNYIFVLDIKEKHNFKLFTIIIHIVEIPTNKRANSYKLNISKIVKFTSYKPTYRWVHEVSSFQLI